MKSNFRLILILFICFCQVSAFAVIRYVTPGGAGSQDGLSWGSAANGSDLQTIINASGPGDEVWVACGTYVPTATLNRSISFAMRNGVAIFGGLQGSESDITERDLTCGSCSILSGEIGLAGIGDNSYTVVYNEDLDNSAVLDGFVISDGNDDRSPTSSGNGLGGGIYNHGFGNGGFCHPVIRNCLFTNNRASWGAGAFNNGYNMGNTQPVYFNSIFYQNHAYIEAGGMDSYAVGGTASPTLYNCIFDSNTSATNVGAMYAWGGNSGGNCHPVLINCVFTNNSALNGYGGAFIADNLDEGGGASSGNCTVTLQNCIVRNNTATGIGPQFYVRGNANAQVLATHSNIDLSGQSGMHVISGPGTGNLDVDPLFLNVSNAPGADLCWLTEDDGLRLSNGSQSVNSGNNSGVHTEDITGAGRISSGTVDMGPYENQTPLSTQILNFNVSRQQNMALISWTTSSEENTASFHVQKSRNGFLWESIGLLKAAGVSAEPTAYSFLDNTPSKGRSYFRLKQMDVDGKIQYSPVKSLLFQDNLQAEFFPNPFKHELQIRFHDEYVHQVVICDMLGKKIFTGQLAKHAWLNLGHLDQGLYFIQVDSKFVTKLVKD